MIHYNGPVSKTPGKVADGATSPQATAEVWHAVDCDRCKTMGLLGLVIERVAADVPERFTVAAVEPYRIGLAWSDDPEADIEWRPMHELDEGVWRPVL